MSARGILGPVYLVLLLVLLPVVDSMDVLKASACTPVTAIVFDDLDVTANVIIWAPATRRTAAACTAWATAVMLGSALAALLHMLGESRDEAAA